MHSPITKTRSLIKDPTAALLTVLGSCEDNTPSPPAPPASSYNQTSSCSASPMSCGCSPLLALVRSPRPGHPLSTWQMYMFSSGSPSSREPSLGQFPSFRLPRSPWLPPSLPGSHCVAKPSGQCCVPSSLGCSASPGSAGHALHAKTPSPLGSEAPLPSCSSSFCSAAAPPQFSGSLFLISLPSNDGILQDWAPTLLSPPSTLSLGAGM